MKKSEQQKTHEKIIDFVNSLPSYNHNGVPRLKKYNKPNFSHEVCSLNGHDLLGAVVLLADTLNLTGGSVADIDLYRLLCNYLLDIDIRKKINLVMDQKT